MSISEIYFRPDKILAMTMLDWFEFGIKHFNIQDIEKALIFMWWLWFRRNTFVHEKVWMDNSVLVDKFNGFMDNVKQALGPVNFSPSLPISSNSDLDTKKIWRPPPDGVVKINCDAAWGDNDLICSIGLIARDSRGLILATAGIPADPSLSVEAAELGAIYQGMKLALDCHFRSITIVGFQIGY